LPTALRDGRYVLLGPLGTGSQGDTFEARDGTTSTSVAIKRFNVQGASTWKDVELAEREARVLASLRHPNLPEYVDHFEEGGTLYLVTQKVEGRDLSQLLTLGKRFTYAELLQLLETFAGIFAYLHQLSPPVIHRDIKPGNIIQRLDGDFALIDFGSVRDGLKPVGGSTVVGTFGFMAPEQFQGRALPASDLYGLGATLITLLTGTTPDRLPHRGLAIDVASAVPPTTPKPWRELLERLLNIDPDQRNFEVSNLLGPLRQAAGEAPKTRHYDAPTSASSAAPNSVTAAPRTEWVFAGGTSFPFFFVLVLSLLRLALFVVLQIVIPALLTILSSVLGRKLRDSAAEVTRAGQLANRQLSQWIEHIERAGPMVIRSRSGWGGAPHHGTGSPWRHNEPSRRRRMRVGAFDVEIPDDEETRDKTRRNRRPR
jgi:serine/threonine protein kinase